MLRKRKRKELEAKTAELEAQVAFDKTNHTSSWRTIQQVQKRKFPTIPRRLIALFALSVVMTIVVLCVVVSFMWRAQTRAYNEATIETLAQCASDTLSLAYSETHSWSSVAVAVTRSLSGQLEDVDICVVDTAGNVVYNDAGQGNEDANAVEDGTIERSAPIKVGEREVGTLTLTSKDDASFWAKDHALFLSSTAKAFWIGASIAVVSACIVAFCASKWMVRPLRRILVMVQALRNGDYTARTRLSGKGDLGQLGETLDAMAATLERTISADHRLTSDVAHELRTPLMAILVNVEGMQDGVLPTDDEHLGMVAGEVKRLSRLVDALLQLSRMENDTHSFEFEQISLGPVVRELVAAQKPLFKSEEITLTYVQNASDAQLVTSVDEDMLKRAVINVLSNALRYTNAHGRVSVTVERLEQDIAIAIADTGIGISSEDLEHVFSRFWRSDASRDRGSGGLGIGLSLVREIVGKHGGYVNVESELGVGTIFTLHIPVVAPAHARTHFTTIEN